MGNLQYNETLLPNSNVGAVVSIKLNYNYENVIFIPFLPTLTYETALIFKK